MNSISNNKGFSLVEILAAVVIIGILSVIAVSSVQMIIGNSKDHYYVDQEESMVMAAQTYYQNNRNQLPKKVGETRQISLKSLINSKFLKNLKKS